MRADPNMLGRPRAAVPTKFAHAHPGVKLTADGRHRKLTEQTQKWVSQTFFGQLLKQMRHSPFKSKMFDGGRGGAAFQEMADQRTADSMARGTGRKLVDGIVRKIEGKAAYAGGHHAGRPATHRAARHDLGVA